MWYDIGLLASIVIGGWLALDVAMAEGWRRRSASIGLLGAFGALWASCEVLLRTAEGPAELALERRLLYLGVVGATFFWYRLAVEADRPGWYRRGPWRTGLAALPSLFFYSMLYWAPDGWVISLYSETPVHGPLWIAAAGASWALIGAGLLHYGRAALRMHRESRVRAIALGIGIGLPLALNVAYAADLVSWDPAPCLLGPAALMIRFAMVDTGLSLYLPLARSDVIEQLDVGVVVVGTDGQVIDANASAARLTGVDEPRGRRFEDLTESLDPGIEVLRFPLKSHFSVTGTAAVLNDRREAIASEQRLQLTGRLEAIGSLTAGIAHEINNPLAYISANLGNLEKLFAELEAPALRDDLPADLARRCREGSESLVDAREGFQRISLLVARLKGFARGPGAAGPGDAPLDLAEAARRAASMAAIGLPADAIRIRSAGPSRVAADEHVVGQILVNLLLNAVQASEGLPQVDVEIEERDGEARVRVCDRGHGLDDHTLERIFDPFFTTKRAGTGLGLSISYDLARRLGGRIEAANRPDGGAAFSLYLPALPERSAPA